MRIFLSYAREDDEAARLIALSLRAATHNVWYEAGGIPGGANWQEETRRIIRDSDWFIVLTSPNYIHSNIGRWELLVALEFQKPILPVVIHQTDLAIFGHIQHIDISDDVNQGIKQVLEFLQTQDELDQIENLAPILRQFSQEIKGVLDTSEQLALPDRVFIAYSHSQRNLAKELADLLAENGKAVFYDAKIHAGATWRQTIQKALDDATHLVVIWTTEAVQSDEVEREVSYALVEGKVIIPILSKEIPRLPYHLHGLQYIVLDVDLKSIEEDLLRAFDQYSEDENIWK